MPLYVKKIITVLVVFFSFAQLQAQISFPKGNVIDTVIHVDVAYDETQIIFHTGQYKSSDYLYQKIADSLDTSWLVTACFNGECRNELEPGGRFMADYGIDDTTCFIAFHVESHGNNGKSKIKYKVINSKNPADTGILDVTVTYISTTGYEENNRNWLQVKCYPNPATDQVTVSMAKADNFILKLTDVQGRVVYQKAERNSAGTTINTSQLKPGIYFLSLYNGESIYTRKLVIE